MRCYPTLRAEYLANAWAYVHSHREEIEQQIRDNEAVQNMANLYANENFPLPVVEKLRMPGHNVLTIQETGKAEQSISDEKVLSNASVDSVTFRGQ